MREGGRAGEGRGEDARRLLLERRAWVLMCARDRSNIPSPPGSAPPSVSPRASTSDPSTGETRCWHARFSRLARNRVTSASVKYQAASRESALRHARTHAPAPGAPRVRPDARNPPSVPSPAAVPRETPSRVPTPRASVRRKERNKMFTITAMTHRPFVGSSSPPRDAPRRALPQDSHRAAEALRACLREEERRDSRGAQAEVYHRRCVARPRPRIPEASFPEARRPTQQSLRLLPG